MAELTELSRKTRRAVSGYARVTLKDVANASGVSTATVSRALNDPKSVTEEVRERITSKIRELGYVRDGKARALASKRSRMIGVIIPTLESAIFASGVNALEKRLDAAGYSLLIAVAGYSPEHELDQVREMIEQGADGIILIGNEHSDAVYNLLNQHNQLFLNIWAYDEESKHHCIGFDNRSAAREATAHLLSLGHRRLAVIAGVTSNNDRASQRVLGIRDALAEHNLTLNPEDLIECRYDLSEARGVARQFLSRSADQRPTALVCGNDVIAFGTLFEALQQGISVPEELSIIGFDNLPLSEHLIPGLTTINIPTEEMGRLAAEFMLDALMKPPETTHIKLQTELIVRGSTAPPQLG